jgi:hypothetical protein
VDDRLSAQGLLGLQFLVRGEVELMRAEARSRSGTTTTAATDTTAAYSYSSTSYSSSSDSNHPGGGRDKGRRRNLSDAPTVAPGGGIAVPKRKKSRLSGREIDRCGFDSLSSGIYSFRLFIFVYFFVFDLSLLSLFIQYSVFHSSNPLFTHHSSFFIIHSSRLVAYWERYIVELKLLSCSDPPTHSPIRITSDGGGEEEEITSQWDALPSSAKDFARAPRPSTIAVTEEKVWEHTL